jgi:hypothetical protein
MPPSPLTLEAPATTAANLNLTDRADMIARLNKALYPVDRQEKFLELQAEVETLFSQLQALPRVSK